MLVSYNWLKDYLGDDAPSAQKIADLLTFHSFEIEEVKEVEGDTVIDIDVLPNRASDCLCHRGIAREIATLIDTPLKYDPFTTAPELPDTTAISVDIEAPEACPRFTATHISGVTVGPSPEWLQDRLRALGQRPINNIVDATNYVMYAMGQPLHAYDATLFPQVDGTWQFGVRYAAAGEAVSLLAEGGADEDRVVTCTGSELLIVDKSSNTPIGLAGVKGGRFAGVHAGTTEIIVEAAHFDPVTTRKTARRLGIVIDASKRFENEPSRELPLYAQRDIIALIEEIAGGACAGIIDAYLQPLVATTVTVDPARVNALLGLTLSATEMQTLLERAGITVEVAGEELHCTGPMERTDLLIEEDFTEEIGRIYGYDKVVSVLPTADQEAEINVRHYYSELIREVLTANGFSEVITSSFRKKDTIKLRNALASDKAHLRSTLAKGLHTVLDQNASHTDLLGTQDTRVFELGTVFAKGTDTVEEHSSLALGVRVKPSGYSGKEDAVLAEVLTKLEERLGTKLAPTIEKGVAEINLTELLTALPAPTAYAAVQMDREVTYQPFSLYPSTSRDIAMWVTEGTTVADVEEVLNAAAGELRVRTTHVDEFSKDGRTSLAFRLVFQAKEKTLTDEEVSAVMSAVNAAVEEQGWEVR